MAAQCPLGFKGTPPVGHPKVAGFDSDATANPGQATKSSRSPYLVLGLEVLFIFVAIYVARNGFPRFITDSLSLGAQRPPSVTSTSAQAKAPIKAE